MSVFLFPSLRLSVCLSVCLSLSLSVFFPLCLSVCLSLALSFFLSVCLSVYLNLPSLSVCLFVCVPLPLPLPLLLLLSLSLSLSLSPSLPRRCWWRRRERWCGGCSLPERTSSTRWPSCTRRSRGDTHTHTHTHTDTQPHTHTSGLFLHLKDKTGCSSLHSKYFGLPKKNGGHLWCSRLEIKHLTIVSVLRTILLRNVRYISIFVQLNAWLAEFMR